MGLFDKKECAICGKKVGLLGSRKVEDGTICSDCTKKLSPFFSERKRSTVEDIRKQLEYREQNKQNLNFFNPSRVYGHGTKIYIDDAQRKFCVSRKSDYRAENADLIDFSQVTAANYRVDEDKTERYMTDSQGNKRPYSPPQYDCSYEFEVYLAINCPYFSEIKFDLTDSFGRPDSRYTDEYRRLEQMANEIVSTFGGGAAAMGAMGYQQMNQQPMQGGYQQAPQQPYGQPVNQAPAQWSCPNCGSINTTNFCQNCGTPKQ